jgi:hypothetical protein
MQRTGCVIAVAVAVTCSYGALRAQSTLDSSGCPRCEIRRVHVATLSAAIDSSSLAATVPLILSDSTIAAHALGAPSVLKFDKSGAPRPSLMIFSARGGKIASGPGDSIYSASPNLIDVFSPDGRLVRSLPLPPTGFGGNFAVLAGGEVAYYTRGNDNGDFLRVIAANGREEKAFGKSVLPPVECGQKCRIRLFAAGSPGEFFAVSPFSYSIENWSTAGELKRRFAISALWFSTAGSTGAAASSPPQPTLSSISLDSAAQVLWVTGHTANEKWRPPNPCSISSMVVNGVAVSLANRADAAACPPAPSHLAGGVAGLVITGTPPGSDVAGRTSVVDAIDPSTGLLLASAKFDGELIYGMPGSYCYVKRETTKGVWSIVIWRLQLVRN